MHFARNAVSDAAVSEAAKWLARGVPDDRWLLLDPVLIDSRRLHSLASVSQSLSSALLDSAFETFGASAPQMLSVAAETDLSSLLERIAELDRTSPAMTFFKSSLPPRRIREAFASLALVHVDNDLRLHCRFADARVLPSLLGVLAPAQLEFVSRRIQAWGWIDSGGEFVCRDFAVKEDGNDGALGDSFKGLELSAEQFAAMLDDSEPDTLFASLLDTVPEIVPDENRGTFRALLAEHLSSADTFNVRQPADRVQFVVLSLTCGPEFHRAASLQETWKMISEDSASLKSIMSTWSEVTWAEIDAGARGAAGPLLPL